ncbi:MAG: PaaI family thioesterase [Anaerolineaceae bacterium]
MENELLDWLQTQYAGRFWGLMGIEIVAAERGVVTYRIALRPDHMNTNNVAHGGVISSLIDSAAGGAVRTVRTVAEIAARPHATSDLHVTYLAPGIGTELTAVARVAKAGRTAIFTEVEAVDDRGRTVARGLVTFVIGGGRQDGAE